MSKTITEILEYLDLGSEKAFGLIKGVCSLGITYLFYLKLGGGVIIPNELSIKVVSDYFINFQFIIPLVLYSIVWFVFSIISPLFIRFLLQFLIEWIYYKKVHKSLKKTIEEVSESDADDLITGFNRIVEYFGVERLDKEQIVFKIKSKLETAGNKEKESQSYDKIDFVILMVQLLFLYVSKVSNTLVFIGWLNFSIIAIFGILITFALFLNFLQRLSERVYSVVTQKIVEESRSAKSSYAKSSY